MTKITPQSIDYRTISYIASGTAINIGIGGTGTSGEAVPDKMIRDVLRADYSPSVPQSGLGYIKVWRRVGTTDTEVDATWVGHISGNVANIISRVGTLDEPVITFPGSSYVRVQASGQAVRVTMEFLDLPR